MATEDIILQALMADAQKREARNPFVIGGKIALGAPRAKFTNPWTSGLATLGQTLAGGLMQGYGERESELENDAIMNAYMDAAAETNREKRMAQLQANPDLAKYANMDKWMLAKQDMEDARALDLTKRKGEIDLALDTDPRKLDFQTKLYDAQAAATNRYKEPKPTIDQELALFEMKETIKQRIKDGKTNPVLGKLFTRLASASTNNDISPIVFTQEEEDALANASQEDKRILVPLISGIRVGKGQESRADTAAATAETKRKQSQITGFKPYDDSATTFDPKTALEINNKQANLTSMIGTLDSVANLSPFAVIGENSALNKVAYATLFAKAREFHGAGAALTGPEVKLIESLNASNIADQPLTTIINSITGKDRPVLISAIKKLLRAQFDSELAGHKWIPEGRTPSDVTKTIFKEQFGIDIGTNKRRSSETVDDSALGDILEGK